MAHNQASYNCIIMMAGIFCSRLVLDEKKNGNILHIVTSEHFMNDE